MNWRRLRSSIGSPPGTRCASLPQAQDAPEAPAGPWGRPERSGFWPEIAHFLAAANERLTRGMRDNNPIGKGGPPPGTSLGRLLINAQMSGFGGLSDSVAFLPSPSRRVARRA
jgi:hypothetical protein